MHGPERRQRTPGTEAPPPGGPVEEEGGQRHGGRAEGEGGQDRGTELVVAAVHRDEGLAGPDVEGHVPQEQRDRVLAVHAHLRERRLPTESAEGRGGGGGGRGVWLGPPPPPRVLVLIPAQNFETSILLAPNAPKQNFGCQPKPGGGGRGGGGVHPLLLRCTAVLHWGGGGAPVRRVREHTY